MKRSNDKTELNNRPLKTKAFTGNHIEEAAKLAVCGDPGKELSNQPIVLLGLCTEPTCLRTVAYWPTSVKMAISVLDKLDTLHEKEAVPLANALFLIADGKLTQTSDGKYNDHANHRHRLTKYFGVAKISELGIFADIIDDIDGKKKKKGYQIDWRNLSPFLYHHSVDFCEEGFF